MNEAVETVGEKEVVVLETVEVVETVGEEENLEDLNKSCTECKFCLDRKNMVAPIKGNVP